MLLHLGKAYYALEVKAMATADLVSGPSWDMDCDCGGPDGPPPPPFFHLPPPPLPPGILGPLKDSKPGECHDSWTCPALALEAGGSFGRFDEGGPPQASPEVPPVAVIIVSATVLGLFLLVAAIIVVSRLWRSYKASSKKASCDLDGADLYEDMPAAPPLLPAVHHCPPPLRYKDPMLPPPRCGLPPTPALHLYSPEPRPDTPSDHLYHHISSGSETCSCSTSEAPSNALLPSSLQLIHSEEDEASSHSSHSYNSSSTATPASSPTPANGGHPHRAPPSLYLCPPMSGGPPTVLLPGYATAMQYAGGKFRDPSSQHSSVYAVNPVNDSHHKHRGSTHDNNMVPLSQIYAPGSHLYEAATLIRPNSNLGPKCSMMHWGNVPAPFVQAVNSHQTLKPNTVHDPRHHNPGTTIPMHNTMVHPLQYFGHSGAILPHTCMQHGPSLGMDSDQYHPPAGYSHHQPYGHSHHNPSRHHPTHLPLPLHSSTLVPNVKLSKSMYNVARSPEDLTPTNSIPIDSIYNVNPHSGVDLIATTCLSTVSSIPNQNDYSLTLDAINLNNASSHSNNRHPEDTGHATALSDTSSSSHPSSGNEGVTVTESSSLDSSGTTSSTIPLTNSMGGHRRDLPPLPSRADRYRIYAHNNDANASGRFGSCRRPTNNNNLDNNNVGNGTVGLDDSSITRNVKSCDDLNNINPGDNPRLVQQHHFGGTFPDTTTTTPAMEESNVANNNYPSYGGLPSQPLLTPLSVATSGKRNHPLSCDEDNHRQAGTNGELFSRPTYPSQRSIPRRGSRPGGNPTVNEDDDHQQEDAIYDTCSDT